MFLTRRWYSVRSVWVQTWQILGRLRPAKNKSQPLRRVRVLLRLHRLPNNHHRQMPPRKNLQAVAHRRLPQQICRRLLQAHRIQMEFRPRIPKRGIIDIFIHRVA
jgi:hypothetical protein